MNYYMLHECGMKKVDEKSYKAHKQYKDGTTKNRDIIDWYNDGENIFFGWAAVDEKYVIAQIVYTTGCFKLKYALWDIC